MDLTSAISAAGTVALILVIVQKTDAIYEYLNMFVFGRKYRALLFLDSYKANSRGHETILEYWSELLGQRPICRFLLKLVTCPYCLGVWLAALFAWSFGVFSMMGAIYIAALFAYFGLIAILDKKR